ncbi:MAG: site-specific integrase [Oscillospiraceae bacterium]
MDIRTLDVDDLQACIDDCAAGKRTKQNMKVTAGLIYKYAIPRIPDMRPLNLGEYLKINDDSESSIRASFNESQLKQIQAAIGRVPYADYVYCHCYLGFRPSALLLLTQQSYNADERCFVGGIKTEAGRDRTVTVSPKIKPYIDALLDKGKFYIFCGSDGEQLPIVKYRAVFYAVLDAVGIDNPTEDGRRKYTPHSCRHTFATLMKRVEGAERDKLALIGHTDVEQLIDYQDVHFGDLRGITDKL